MKNKKDIIPNGINNVRMAKILEEQSKTMPADQVYRELIKNSLEAIQRVKIKDYKGKIEVNPFSTKQPNKFSIVDNGIGMSKNNIVKLVNNFAETEEESKDGNFGHGTKIAAQCTNKEGVLYQSFRKGENEGSAVLIKKSDAYGYGAWIREDTNSARQVLNLDQKPKLIEEKGQGPSVTLLGNSVNEDTTKAPERYSVNSLVGRGRMGERWLLTFANTKFFTLPKNVKFSIRWSPNKPDIATVKGHKHYLDELCTQKGILKIERAKIHWWIIKENFNSNKTNHHLGGVGQLSYLNKEEILSIEYNCTGRKNPLRNWGLPFTDTKVALVIEPINFSPDVKRGTLSCNETGLDYKKFVPQWKEQWINLMPQEVAEFEENKAKEKTVNGEDFSNLGKKIAKDLKGLYVLPSDGGINGDSTVVKTGSFLGNQINQNLNDSNKRNGNHLGNEGFGNFMLDAIIKKTSSPKTGTKPISSPNLWPNIKRTSESINNQDIDYTYETNTFMFNINSDLINEYIDAANLAKPQKKMAKKILAENMIKKLCIQIAYFRGRDLGISEEEKEQCLNNNALTLSILDKTVMIEELKRQLQSIYRKIKTPSSVNISEMTDHALE